jgi:hypothetical protein
MVLFESVPQQLKEKHQRFVAKPVEFQPAEPDRERVFYLIGLEYAIQKQKIIHWLTGDHTRTSIIINPFIAKRKTTESIA